MITTRRVFWLVGLAVGTGLALAIPPSGTLADLRVFALLGGLLAIGLIGELVVALRELRAASKPVILTDNRAADGQVELARVAGVRSEPNGDDPRFRRFIALESIDGIEPAPTHHERSMAPLLGKVVLVSLFVGRDGRRWTDAEIARAHASLLTAGGWIEREAIRWGAPANVALAETYFVAEDEVADDVEVMFVPQGDEVGPWEAHALTKTLISASRAAARLGFHDAADLVARINVRVHADVSVWLFHPLRAGRSMAVPLDRTELPGVSLAVCYAREASFPEPLADPPAPDSATIAHELLHLFGATDKYGRSLDAFPPRSVTPRDIMRLDYSTLARMSIDPLTAAEIGWGSVRQGG